MFSGAKSVRCTLVLFCACVLTPVTFGADGGKWLSVSETGDTALTGLSETAAPTFRILESGGAVLRAHVESDGVALKPRKTKGGGFVVVDWPDAAVTGEIGTPALPVVRRLFVAPHGAHVSVSVDAGKSVVVDLADMAMPCMVKPVQAPIEKLPGAKEAAPFHFDPAAYAVDRELLPQRATVTELGLVRGQRLFLLEVRPVSYNPGQKTLTFWNDVAVNLLFQGGRGFGRDLSVYPGLKDAVLNPEQLITAGRGSGNYLIVVPTTFETAMASFVAAKEAQGFTVATHVVSPGTSNNSIKSHIQSLWGTADAPEYILLVGDVDKIPHWVGQGTGSPDTDIQYGCMDGTADWYPDIAVGRFPVDTTSELQTLIDKTLYYENGPLADPDYRKRAVFMASVDNHTISEGTHNYVIDTWLEPNGYVCDRLYQVTYGADTQDVRDSFNDGRFYGVYSGHGGSTSWADGPPFSQSDVNGLTNANMYAFICSFACVTGDYAGYDECFMETWVLAPNKAAVASWGSSVNSYWDEDDILERRLFDAIFDNSDDVKTEAGPIYDEAKMRLLAHYGATSTVRRYFEMYNLMGDPALPLPSACSDAGEVALDSAKYACADTVGIEVADCGLNLDDNVVDTVDVTIVSDSEAAGELVTLFETDSASAVFEGAITVNETDGNGVLLVAEGDAVTVTYIDADDGQGGIDIPVTDTALIDCTAPTIANVQATDIEPRSATVQFDSNEAVRGTVHYGTACGSLTETAVGSGYANPTSVGMSGLQDNTTYFYTVEAADQAGNTASDDNGGACYSFTTPEVPDFFTEIFESNDNDLDNIKLTFTPNGSNDFYAACAESITALPTDPAGGTNLGLDDDDYATVSLSGGQTVSIYGQSYSQIFPSSNGYLTFVHGETGYTESLETHFSGIPRISALFDDLNPDNGGSVSWKQLADRVAVTWDDVPEYSNTGSNTFQIELFFDGTITISYLSCSAQDGLAGLSDGTGLDPAFFESDLSNLGSCGPQPPLAQSGSANTAEDTPVTITLQATDDGLPDPPAALTYVVAELPDHGTLFDQGTVVSSVPYTLTNGNIVEYMPDANYRGLDEFQFLANDGGTPADGGGDSNLASIDITVGGAAWDPVAYDGSTTTGVSLAVDVALSGQDPNGDPLTFIIESLPAMGVLMDPNGQTVDTVPHEISNGNTVTYQPPCGQFMEETFTFSAKDATAGSNVATQTVIVSASDARAVYVFDMSDDPGWSTEGQWAHGKPLGGGTHNGDPASGHTGENVYGYNLNGDYTNNMPAYYLTTPALDCSSMSNVELRFYRWLGAEDYDAATVEVSNDGVAWIPIWDHVGMKISDSAWHAMTLDVSAVADGRPTVYVRWGMGPTDYSVSYPGWNIDDVALWGVVDPYEADFNGDGLMTSDDCSLFEACLGGPDAPMSPTCMCKDLDADGDVDLADYATMQEMYAGY